MSVEVVIQSEGRTWEGVKGLRINKSLSNVVHSLDLETSSRITPGLEDWNIRATSPIEVYLNGQLAFSGYVYQQRRKKSANNHSVRLRAGSMARDIVKSSHVGPYFWKSVSARQVVDDVLAGFEVGLTNTSALSPIDEAGFRVSPSDTPFSILKKLAERDGLTVYSVKGRELRIQNEPPLTAAVELAAGDYIEIELDEDFDDVFSDIIVKTQVKSCAADFSESKHREFITKNPAMPRHRPKVFVRSWDATGGETAAAFANKRLTGGASTVSMAFKSPETPIGGLWDIGQRSFVYEPSLDIRDELTVEGLEFSFTESGGFVTKTTNVIPSAFTVSKSSRLAKRSGGRFFAQVLDALSL